MSGDTKALGTVRVWNGRYGIIERNDVGDGYYFDAVEGDRPIVGLRVTFDKTMSVQGHLLAKNVKPA
jgi:hypothetical protein